METLRSWILRICHVIRTVAFTNQSRLSFARLGALVFEPAVDLFSVGSLHKE